MKIIETILSIPIIIIYLCSLGMLSFNIKFPSGNTLELDGWLM
ncbi:MAG: hypothetical protein K0R34_2143 [Herbinix sp.]|nr:hypothetical protein [Herbinix sp.]